MKTIYICSDTITGIFSGIYDAWKAGKTEQDCGITFLGAVEQELFCDYVEVEESADPKAYGNACLLGYLPCSAVSGPGQRECSSGNHDGGKKASGREKDHGSSESSNGRKSI